LTYAAGGVIAVHSRHADIHQDYLRQKLRRRLYRLFPIVRNPNFVVEHLHHQGQRPRRIEIVVDHQHS
jgi:hypothetical protein